MSQRTFRNTLKFTAGLAAGACILSLSYIGEGNWADTLSCLTFAAAALVVSTACYTRLVR